MFGSRIQDAFAWLRANIADVEVIVLRILAIIHVIRHF